MSDSASKARDLADAPDHGGRLDSWGGVASGADGAAQQQRHGYRAEDRLASLSEARVTVTTPPSKGRHARSTKPLFNAEINSTGLSLTSREEAEGASATVARAGPSATTANHGERSSGTDAVLLPNGRLQVRVTRDGKTTVEEMEPKELARLYAQQQATLRHMQGRLDFLTVPDWVRLNPMLGPYLAEATGTFAWVLTLSLVSVRNESLFDKADDTNVTCLPIGFMFMSMVFTLGYVSGGHFNPAVSLAVFLLRKMELAQCLGYITCQVAAAFGAGVVAMLIQGSANVFVPSVEPSYVGSGIFAECVYTFAIALVVLNVSYSRQSGCFFSGFAVSMTMAAGSAGVGRISGGTFNPAAATGLQLALCMTSDCSNLKSVWVYWLAPLVGAVLASFVFSQTFQPTNTQVLQDHKVLQQDPGSPFIDDGGWWGHRGGPDGAEARPADGCQESPTSSGSEVDADVHSSNSSTHGDIEMSDARRRPFGVTARLNESLSEPTAAV